MEKKVDLKKLEIFAKNLAKNSKLGDLYLLSGDLGSGKTTFSRFFINSIFDKNKVKKPKLIQSPSFPILINYHVKNFEIYHYDLYRLKNAKELKELNITENLIKNITLIEWPEIIISKKIFADYCHINFEIINSNNRLLNISNI